MEYARLNRKRNYRSWLLSGAALGIVVVCGALGAASAGRPAASGSNPAHPARSATTAMAFAGRRDPFRLPLPPAPASRTTKKTRLRPRLLPPGIPGLVIKELQLEGIVSENSGAQMIAIVTNSTHRAYFLREHDALYDGVVTRITPEAVYFAEKTRATRNGENQIVMRLSAVPGEGQ